MLGLGIGIGSCILAAAYIRYELSWDQHHEQVDRIFRVLWTKPAEGLVSDRPTGALGPALQEAFPEVVDFVRSEPMWVWVDVDGEPIREDLKIVDASVLDVFTFPLLVGDKDEVFRSPNSVVVTASAGKRWFGDEDPVGKTVSFDSRRSGGEYQITGVLKDLPANASYQFDALTTTLVGSEIAKIPGRLSREESVWAQWRDRGGGPKTYLLLRSPDDAPKVEAKLAGFLDQHMGAEWSSQYQCRLQPVSDIHLYHSDYGLRRFGVIGAIPETRALLAS